jgi:hypothetical protein
VGLRFGAWHQSRLEGKQAPVLPAPPLRVFRGGFVCVVSIADRDLVSKTSEGVLVPGTRLDCVARAPARGVRRCAHPRGVRKPLLRRTSVLRQSRSSTGLALVFARGRERARAQYSAFCFEVVRVFVFFAVDFGEPAIFSRGVRGLGSAFELFTGKRQFSLTE